MQKVTCGLFPENRIDLMGLYSNFIKWWLNLFSMKPTKIFSRTENWSRAKICVRTPWYTFVDRLNIGNFHKVWQKRSCTGIWSEPVLLFLFMLFIISVIFFKCSILIIRAIEGASSAKTGQHVTLYKWRIGPKPKKNSSQNLSATSCKHTYIF